MKKFFTNLMFLALIGMAMPAMAQSPSVAKDGDTVEATIDASQILYWVGEGDNEVILAVNWAETALAWGYRFSESSVSVATVMTAIAADDPRLSFSGSGLLDDILFFDAAAGMTDTLRITPGNYWESTRNGVMDAGMGQQLQDGDFEKWSDPAAGIAVDSFYYEGWGWIYTNVYTMPIFAITDPDTTNIPDESSLAAADIRYWVGEGSNEVVLAVNWADTALAWGYRFDEPTVTVENVLAAIAAADPRFSYSGSGFINDIYFFDAKRGMTDTLHITPGNYWGSSRNGVMDAGMSQTLVDGDFEKWADPAAGAISGCSYFAGYGWFYNYAYPMDVTPVAAPLPDEATIDASEILYWVGEGSHQVVMAVNWADTALAWGYRFADDSVTVETMMNAIAAADPRLSLRVSGYLDDILYYEEGMADTLRVAEGSYWSSTRNGYGDMGMAQYLVDGDFEKWAVPAAGVVSDSVYYEGWGWSYIYIYPMAITPVTVPAPVAIDAVASTVELNCWPNPVVDRVTVTISHESSAQLFDQAGRLVAAYTLHQGENTLDLSSLHTSVYLLRVGNTVQKLIKR